MPRPPGIQVNPNPVDQLALPLFSVPTITIVRPLFFSPMNQLTTYAQQLQTLAVLYLPRVLIAVPNWLVADWPRQPAAGLDHGPPRCIAELVSA